MEVHSSYIAVDTFNDRFSDEPVAQFSLIVDLGQGFYAEPYVYTGFRRPFGDEGSEYGGEAGWEGDVAPGWTLNVAAGRWANYGGEGFGAGDWFGRAGVSRGDLRVSTSYLVGASDTLLLNAEYELRPTEALTVTPKIAYVAADDAWNLGLEVGYELTPGISLNLRAVAPQRPEGREVYGSAGLVWSFPRD